MKRWEKEGVVESQILVARKNHVIYCSSNSIFLVKHQLREKIKLYVNRFLLEYT